jgi:hypothetical protein
VHGGHRDWKQQGRRISVFEQLLQCRYGEKQAIGNGYDERELPQSGDRE